jgi:DNA polymerase I
VLHDAKPQLHALHAAGLELGGLEGDSLLAAYLLRPANPERDLADLVQRYLDEVLPQGDPNQLVPDESVASGPEARAWYALRVMAALREKLDDSSAGVLARLELPVLPVLEAMEERGVTVDGSHLAGLSTALGERAAELAGLAFAEIDMEVNLGSPKQLQEVLFERLALPKTRRTKTGYTTDAAALADLYEKTGHPFLDLLLKHRDVTKLRQIIETLTASIGDDGRVHTTYLQTGASTGRLASTDPNLQNIPVRSEEGRRIREAFRAGEGFETLMTADYSQIEMRIMAHLSEDAGLIEAFTAGEDLHSFVGSRVFGVGTDEVTGEMRSKVKAMSYGLAYGLSAFGLSRQLGIEVPDARTLVSDYFARFGGVRDYLRNVVEQAKVDGYTETIDGRRRFFPELSSPNRVLRENAERQALNAPIQGSAADIMKRAMVQIEADVAEAGLRSQMLLQVHDELIFEVAEGEWDALERIVLARMSTAATLRVPLEVHVGRGVNWNAAAH